MLLDIHIRKPIILNSFFDNDDFGTFNGLKLTKLNNFKELMLWTLIQKQLEKTK